jgi:polysaccharide deacetylase 2 family uncharacterized protein YibQ
VEQDELNTPLGQDEKKNDRKTFVLAPQFAAVALGLAALVVVAKTIFTGGDPSGGSPGGEPIAVIAIKDLPGQASEPKPAPTKDAAGGGENPASETMRPADPPAMASSNSKTITVIDGSSGKRQKIVIPNAEENGNAVRNDQALLEKSRHGGIPKIRADGARAAVVYAHSREVPLDRKNYPRIAIIVTGVGISASGTAAAFATLPAPITFAVAPYAANIENVATRALTEKHELLLQVPMEPFDYPDNDPGPQTLLTSLSGEQNVDRLHWFMSRMRGYVGITNYMGARFTASDKTLRPVLADVGKRGLIYVDDGSTSRSGAAQVAESNNLPFAKADIALDVIPTASAIEHALAHLELIARQNGSAIGIAKAEPAVIAQLAQWAKKVESRGFVLVPITMVATKEKSS